MRVPKNINLISKYIASDIYDRVGHMVAKDMKNAYNHAIGKFYDSYKPHAYKRRFRSYFFAHESGTRGYVKFVEKDSTGTGFTVRMNVTSDNIRLDYTSITGNFKGGILNDYVFYNTFALGQHGGPLPLSILPEETQIGILQNTRSKRWGRYKGDWWWIPPHMETPPKAIMDNWFQNYTVGGGIHKTVDKVVVHSIEKILKTHERLYGGKKE